jgi:hypothetical protein
MYASLTTKLAMVAMVPLAASLSHAQGYATSIASSPDAFATETGGFLLTIPGIGEFTLFADGQFVTRANGTARLSAHTRLTLAYDRQLYVELEFSGRVAPGDMGYPPVGSPVLTLLPDAYVPTGTVDPATYVYYTQVTGNMSGLAAWDGALITVANTTVAQSGDGATNKNAQPGIGVDLALTVVQQPPFGFFPTGPAELRATLVPANSFCATHADRNAAISAGPVRVGLDAPGLASDYVFLPVGSWTEFDDGTAQLEGIVRRQADHDDQWTLSLTLSGRVDPGDAAHPPVGYPVLGLLPTAYVAQGGPVDPTHWRYYTAAAGTLVGAGINEGGSIQLTNDGATQVGFGADQANLYFGVSGALDAGTIVQPSSRAVTITDSLQFRSNFGSTCILPPMVVTTGSTQSRPTVTDQEVTFVGDDLGWSEQALVGTVLLTKEPRAWFGGNIRVVDHNTVVMRIPQGLEPANYPTFLLNAAATSTPLALDLTAPTAVTLHTEVDRLAGETQHWVAHKGPTGGVPFTLLVLSLSNLPTVVPGLVSLDIGDSFSSFLVYDGALNDPLTGAAVVTLNVTPDLAGFRFYAQAVMFDLAAADPFPVPESNFVFTDYL